MQRLGFCGREPDCDQVDDAQHDGDRVPNPGLEGHGEILSSRSNGSRLGWRTGWLITNIPFGFNARDFSRVLSERLNWTISITPAAPTKMITPTPIAHS